MTTSILTIDGPTVRKLLDWPSLIDTVRAAMIATSQGEAELPLRWGLKIPGDRGIIGMMPGYLAPAGAAGVKLVSLNPHAAQQGRSSHLGLMVVYDADGLVPRAIMCGATITALRTAAATAVATEALARKDVKTLAILGSGEQAEAHLQVLPLVRPFSDIRIWGRDSDKAQALAARFKSCRAVPSVAEAVAGATVVCTVTSSSAPVLFGSQVEPGMHINLVGSSTPDKREVDDDLVASAEFFVDYCPSAMAQAGEFLHARSAGRVNDRHIRAEIGEVLAGRRGGRATDETVTIYKSLGIAAQDIAAAWLAVSRAHKWGVGTSVDI